LTDGHSNAIIGEGLGLPTAFDEVEGGVDELGVEGFGDGGEAGMGGVVVLVVVPVPVVVSGGVVVVFGG